MDVTVCKFQKYAQRLDRMARKLSFKGYIHETTESSATIGCVEVVVPHVQPQLQPGAQGSQSHPFASAGGAAAAAVTPVVPVEPVGAGGDGV